LKKTGLQAPAPAARPLDAGVILLPFLLLGFILARFLAPVFKLLPACTFRSVVGIPCPSCGATRAGLALAHGELFSALLDNPFFVIGIAVLSVWSFMRTAKWWSGKGREDKALNFNITRRQRLKRAVMAAIILNWIYLIVHAAT